VHRVRKASHLDAWINQSVIPNTGASIQRVSFRMQALATNTAKAVCKLTLIGLVTML
jgi:hypothetical protein